MPVPLKHDMGWIYMLWGVGTHSFKIGFTRENIDYRANIIMRYSPVPIKIIAYRSGTMVLERLVHTRLRQYRIHGEWFLLPELTLWSLLQWFLKGWDVDKVDR